LVSTMMWSGMNLIPGREDNYFWHTRQ